MFRLAKYLKHYKIQSIFGPLFKLIEACFELAVPLIMADIIDTGIRNEDSSYILWRGGLLILLGVLGLTCSLTAQYFAAKASVGFGTELRSALFSHINSLSYSEIDKLGSNTLVTRMTSDINQAQTGVNMILRLFLRSPFIVLGSVIMAFTISVRLTLIFLIISPLLAFVIYKIMSLTIPRYKRVQKTLDKTSLITSEALVGTRVIRAFSRQKDEQTEFENNAEELRRMQLIAGKISAVMNPATYVIVNLAIAAILWYGGKAVDLGTITQGEVIALLNYMNQILLALLIKHIFFRPQTRALGRLLHADAQHHAQFPDTFRHFGQMFFHRIDDHKASFPRQAKARPNHFIETGVNPRYHSICALSCAPHAPASVML